jgi:hypothetical protein
MRSLLLICLLICVSCATGFPTRKLEEGMTMETVQEKFGAPIAEEPGCLTYWNERQEWITTLHPFSPIMLCMVHWIEGLTWSEAADDLWIIREPMLLDFEEEKLARWERVKRIQGGTIHTPSTMTYSYTPMNPSPGGVAGAPSWHSSGGGSSVWYLEWPEAPTCTDIRGMMPEEDKRSFSTKVKQWLGFGGDGD